MSTIYVDVTEPGHALVTAGAFGFSGRITKEGGRFRVEVTETDHDVVRAPGDGDCTRAGLTLDQGWTEGARMLAAWHGHTRATVVIDYEYARRGPRTVTVEIGGDA